MVIASRVCKPEDLGLSKLQAAVIAGLIFIVVLVMGLAAIGHFTQNNGRVTMTPTELAPLDMTVGQMLDKLATTAKDMKGEKVAANVAVIGARVKDGARLTYFYAITNGSDGQIDTTAAQEIAEKLARKVCRDRISRAAIDGGGLIVFDYRGTEGETVTKIKVDRAACTAVM